jgi:hypothetical protein
VPGRGRKLPSHCRICAIVAHESGYHRALAVLSMKLPKTQPHTSSDKQGGPRQAGSRKWLPIDDRKWPGRSMCTHPHCGGNELGCLHAMRAFPFQIGRTRAFYWRATSLALAQAQIGPQTYSQCESAADDDDRPPCVEYFADDK